MSQLRDIIIVIIKVYLIISPFILLFLIRKIKKTSNYKTSHEFNINEDILKKLLESAFGEDYTTMLLTYGSLAAYEDARSKDFEVMRNYFKYNLKVMKATSKIIKTLSNETDDTEFKMLLNTVHSNIENCCEDMINFITTEEEAHTKSHSSDEILNHLNNKKS